MINRIDILTVRPDNLIIGILDIPGRDSGATDIFIGSGKRPLVNIESKICLRKNPVDLLIGSAGTLNVKGIAVFRHAQTTVIKWTTHINTCVSFFRYFIP